MPEFTLELDDQQEEVIQAFSDDLDRILRDPLKASANGFSKYENPHLTCDIDAPWPRVTIYFSIFLSIAAGFTMLVWNASAWVFTPAFVMFLMSIVGSSYWWAYVLVIPKLRSRGYRGRVRLVHAEGLF